jgi:hypothetical protein
VFNTHLANDPLTRDAYEINAPGVSLSFAPEEVEGLDLSLTAYSSKDALFKDPPTNQNPNPSPEDDLCNYIVNATLAPAGFLTMSTYFDSEHGATGDRNNSWGASISVAFQDTFSFDAEYIKALERDKNHPKDSVYSVSGAVKVLPPLELVGRFEGYDDGVNGDQVFDPDSLVGVEYRVSAGANYELAEHATLMSEFRVTEVEDPDVSNLKDWVLRLRVEF